MHKQRDAGGTDHFHAVRFYDSADSLCRLVSSFLSEGLTQGLPAVIIATPEHRDGNEQQLRALGLDVARLKKDGDLLVLDAARTLSKFMIEGMPDPGLFRSTMIPVIETASRGRRGCVIRAYGEMVDVLWKAGDTVAATRLEMLWNELAQTHEFSMLCGYAMGNFYKGAAMEEIMACHTHVLSATGAASTVV